MVSSEFKISEIKTNLGRLYNIMKGFNIHIDGLKDGS